VRRRRQRKDAMDVWQRQKTKDRDELSCLHYEETGAEEGVSIERENEQAKQGDGVGMVQRRSKCSKAVNKQDPRKISRITMRYRECREDRNITEKERRVKLKWGAIIIEFELLLQTNNLGHKPRSLEAAASPSCFMRVVTEKVVSLV
jgi:hypothetical protein